MPMIRKATTSDIPLIRDIAMAIWPQTYTSIVGSAQVDYMLNQFYTPSALQQQMADGQQFLLAYDDEGLPAAFASYSPFDDHSYKLNKLYILPDRQGKGMGRAVMEHVKNELAKSNITRIVLNVNIYNSPALAFYTRLGFQQIMREDIDIGNGYFMNDYVLQIAIP